MQRRRSVCRKFSPEVREAAVQRYLTSDLTMTAVGEQFGTGRYNLASWLKAAESRNDVSKKPKQHLVAAATPTDGRSAQLAQCSGGQWQTRDEAPRQQRHTS